jgi:hypothetical protein
MNCVMLPEIMAHDKPEIGSQIWARKTVEGDVARPS